MTVIILSVFLAGALTGWIARTQYLAFVFRKKPIIYNTPGKKYETYGHPQAPVPALENKLPKPPTNHAWEISVIQNGEGRPALKLALLNLFTNETVESMDKDLIVESEYKSIELITTWAEHYRKYPMNAERNFGKFIDGFVDWANNQKFKHDTYNITPEYVIKTG